MLLKQFRQFPQSFGHALLGMLLFVWLSMAISPCVMASELLPVDSTEVTKMIAQHTNMDECHFCPDDSMNTSLCQNIHNIVSDGLSFVIEPVDTDTFILFEIQTAYSLVQLSAIVSPANKQRTATQKSLSPLAMTGILRI